MDVDSAQPSANALGKRKRVEPSHSDEHALLQELESLMARGTAKSRLLAKTITSKPYFPICPHVTLGDCSKARTEAHVEGQASSCSKVHLQPLNRRHTEASLGHCSYLNTCYGEPSYAASPSLGGGSAPPNRPTKDCRYLHFEVCPPPDDLPSRLPISLPPSLPPPSGPLVPRVPDLAKGKSKDPSEGSWPASWISCDVRKFDLEVLGTFDVIMADPPWDIHMSLPYGTMTDEEMRNLPIPALQSSTGVLFLWVTARAMDLGRDLLSYWGYRRVDEIVWAKTGQLGRLIRTGRTGHWLNHTCEHLLVGLKSPAHHSTPDVPNTTWPDWLQRGMDTDVLVSEVKETSRKPDEIYNLIERCCQGGRKLEIFARKHNTRPGWLSLGNQLGNDCVWEPSLAERLAQKYPERTNLAGTPGGSSGPGMGMGADEQMGGVKEERE
ncbi:MT-A70-domain-containing protein [Mrakia frigida]|uniref:mRNA (N6-adenosine)-methyltransferase n=1 Tax=Mrakia frigida TaxID=29902 RepID=UPI003FCBFA76